jgi:hypothetical protein
MVFQRGFVHVLEFWWSPYCSACFFGCAVQARTVCALWPVLFVKLRLAAFRTGVRLMRRSTVEGESSWIHIRSPESNADPGENLTRIRSRIKIVAVVTAWRKEPSPCLFWFLWVLFKTTEKRQC